METQQIVQGQVQAEAAPSPKVGDVWYSSWGYDQTNIDFYQITKVSGQWVTLQKLIAESSPEEGCMTAKKWPKKEPPPFVNTYVPDWREKATRRKWRASQYSGFYCSLTSYSGAMPWDGKPKTYSWYA